jgi:hypothetical protein
MTDLKSVGHVSGSHAWSSLLIPYLSVTVKHHPRGVCSLNVAHKMGYYCQKHIQKGGMISSQYESTIAKVLGHISLHYLPHFSSPRMCAGGNPALDLFLINASIGRNAYKARGKLADGECWV